MKKETFDDISRLALLWAKRGDRVTAAVRGMIARTASGLKRTAGRASGAGRLMVRGAVLAAVVVAAVAIAGGLFLLLRESSIWLVDVFTGRLPTPYVGEGELALLGAVATLLAWRWQVVRRKHRPAAAMVRPPRPAPMPGLKAPVSRRGHAAAGLALVAAVVAGMGAHVAFLPAEPQTAGLEVIAVYAVAAGLWGWLFRERIAFLYSLVVAAPVMAGSLWLVQVVAVSVYKHTLALSGRFTSTAASWEAYVADGQLALGWLVAGAATSAGLLWLHWWSQGRHE
jgi:hypothetical protein